MKIKKGGKTITLTESDLKRIVKRIISEQGMGKNSSKLSGDDLYKHILDKYIRPVMDEHGRDEFGDEFEYYDNVIGWGIEQYLESEEPEREDDWNYRGELENEIKDWWQPI
jgi:hypothetical protein